MADITLSAASRSNLLSLQRTQDLVNRTQNRLSTGKEINSITDDALKFFQAKSLSDRASDLTERKESMEQGINALKAVVEATDKMEDLVDQMKGILNNARSATKEQRKEFEGQIGELAFQIEKLVLDTSYQGQNLLNSTASTLSIRFSEKADSKLEVNGVNFNASTFFLKSDSTAGGIVSASKGSAVLSKLGLTTQLSAYSISVAAEQASFNKDIDSVIAGLDKTIENLRAKSSVFANSVAILQVRVDFTENYTNVLQEGSDKLTLADLNEEGANLLALQTRQQLGIQALSFAGQAEQGILGLFR